jgi:hypothetical protein
MHWDHLACMLSRLICFNSFVVRFSKAAAKVLPSAGEVSQPVGLLAEGEDLHGGRLSFQDV